ncbi:Rad9-domain-containing protein [Globomyces pollinis-pini]|nr:Rad9-domain-containing protein [Globomyces pollinis-pini]
MTDNNIMTLSVPAFKVLCKCLMSLMKYGDRCEWGFGPDLVLILVFDLLGILFNLMAKLKLSSVNQNESCFISHKFESGFFDHLQPSNFNIKALIKPIYNVLKLNLDSVQVCHIALENDRLKFKINCKFGIIKTHSFQFEDCSTVQAVYDSDVYPFTWTIQPKAIHDQLANFPSKLEEITMLCNSNMFQLKNLQSPQQIVNDLDRLLSTQIALDITEFESFGVNQETHLTFNIHDFKKALVFGDSIGVLVTAKFGKPGSPLVIECSSKEEMINQPESFCRTDFVLATFDDVINDQSQSSQRKSQAKGKANMNSQHNLSYVTLNTNTQQMQHNWNQSQAERTTLPVEANTNHSAGHMQSRSHTSSRAPSPNTFISTPLLSKNKSTIRNTNTAERIRNHSTTTVSTTSTQNTNIIVQDSTLNTHSQDNSIKELLQLSQQTNYHKPKKIKTILLQDEDESVIDKGPVHSMFRDFQLTNEDIQVWNDEADDELILPTQF